ncbi:Coiled-coil domain containing 124 family protein [Besnoitia besnoiti]|uniref:Coiled-coil domain containing 124 family protein n=1 Tax=Besnoitia besnoiti TaxID=94643 RepID=A0A2A9MGQ1_BESBE|nr:Coiled-coil domain containing 124 family protein [Besnoitia besnoiti]PFH37155.1 Coiled-coil domain containing 124 family protein [Besnoitia besnoiti]
MAPSTNQKSIDARERKAAAAAEAARIKAEEAERKKWEDNDKGVARKQERKAAAQQKAEERAQHKAELRRLAAEEDAAAARNTQKKAPPPKLTRAQIQQRALLAAAQKKKAEEEEAKSRSPKEMELQPNINHIIRQQTLEAREAGVHLVTASGVEEALAAMSLSDGADRHPERRMKAAYKAYEEAWLPRLKAENPSLKRSQLMEMLNKQWRKAPENPMNQAAAAAALSPSTLVP